MTSLLAFLILIGVLITAHEFGHFIVAKLCGVKVHTFSVGFGHTIFSKTIGETEYRIAMLPLGGYVRLHGMEREFGEFEETQLTENEKADDGSLLDPDQGRALQDKPAWMRVLIFVAGPMMNLLLPFILLPPLFFWASQYDEVVDTQMGAVDAGLPAFKAGLRDGDQILEINGQEMSAFWQIQDEVNHYKEGDKPLKVLVKRPYSSQPISVNLRPQIMPSTDRFLGMVKHPPRIGFQPAALSADYIALNNQSLFTESGGQPFDRVVEVNGVKVNRHIDFLKAVHQTLTASSLDQFEDKQYLNVKVQRLLALDPNLKFLRKSVEVDLAIPLDQLKVRYKTQLTTPQNDQSVQMLNSLGILQASACISSVDPNSAAAEVLQTGDCLIAVDGERHSLAVFFEERLRHQPQVPKQLTILRNGSEKEIELKLREEVHRDPLAGEIRFWQLGFTLMGLSKVGAMVAPAMIKNKERTQFSWVQTKRKIHRELTQAVYSLGGLFSGAVSPTQLSGPITIFYVAGRQAEAGWIPFINLMVMISLSIALLNLLPVPGLDGGHIVFASIEMITGRTLPTRARAFIQGVGVFMILALILFALGNDVLRMWRLSQGG